MSSIAASFLLTVPAKYGRDKSETSPDASLLIVVGAAPRGDHVDFPVLCRRKVADSLTSRRPSRILLPYARRNFSSYISQPSRSFSPPRPSRLSSSPLLRWMRVRLNFLHLSPPSTLSSQHTQHSSARTHARYISTSCCLDLIRSAVPIGTGTGTGTWDFVENTSCFFIVYSYFLSFFFFFSSYSATIFPHHLLSLPPSQYPAHK